jgi:hypothetical protein
MDYKVYYKMGTDFRTSKNLTAEGFAQNYKFVRSVPDGRAKGLGDVYEMMQAHNWSPNGEARPIIKALGLEHTSMSVGDLILESQSGKIYQVAPFGFEEVTNLNLTETKKESKMKDNSVELSQLSIADLATAYNAAADIVGLPHVNKFSDKRTAVRRVMQIQDQASRSGKPAPDPIPEPEPALAPAPAPIPEPGKTETKILIPDSEIKVPAPKVKKRKARRNRGSRSPGSSGECSKRAALTA